MDNDHRHETFYRGENVFEAVCLPDIADKLEWLYMVYKLSQYDDNQDNDYRR